MSAEQQRHYTFVTTINAGRNDGAWIAACCHCGRLNTELRMTRESAEGDAREHGELVSVDESKRLMGKALYDALGPIPRLPRGGRPE